MTFSAQSKGGTLLTGRRRVENLEYRKTRLGVFG